MAALVLRLALVLVLATSCTATPAPPSGQSFPAPKWVVSAPDPALAEGEGQQMAGWDGGWLLASDSAVLASKDGRGWHAALPDGVLELGSGVSPDTRITAGHGAAAYLLGQSAQGFAVWRTEDGQQWATIPLDLGDVLISSPYDIELTITAGPRGVLVVGSSDGYDGVYVWHSPDGRSFGAMTRIPKPAEEWPPNIDAVATSTGFLVVMNGDRTMLLSLTDGAHWRDITGDLGRVGWLSHVSGNGSTVVAFNLHKEPGGSNAGEQRPWYLRDGTWRPATLDPGQLPDAGVVPADQRRVNVVRDWGTGFIAVGNTWYGDAGLVWYSADGAAWTRMPVRDNGFEAASQLMDVAVSGREAVLVGTPSGEASDDLLMWRADVPPRPNR
jgi:hypothetical protein